MIDLFQPVRNSLSANNPGTTLRLILGQRSVAAYALVALSVAGVTVMRALLDPVLGPWSLLLLYWPVVAAGAGLGGPGPGLAAAVLSVAAAPLLREFRWDEDGAHLLGFAATSGVIVASGAGQAAWSALRKSSGGVTGFRQVLRDVSGERAVETPLVLHEARMRELQLELFHASRLSAMGTMGAAIAHELDQPLAAIVNYAETSRAMLTRALHAHPELAGAAVAAELAAREAVRAGEIIGGMRAFISRGESGKLVEDLIAIVAEAIQLSLIGKRERRVTIVRDFGDLDSCPVIVNRVQIQQIMVNLLRNAAEAMSASGVIRIIIRRRGAEAAVSVCDNGPGLPTGVQPGLFRSFASTKPKGVGLGLSICRTIVEAHGGTLSARNRPGGGAEFRFNVPRAMTVDD